MRTTQFEAEGEETVELLSLKSAMRHSSHRHSKSVESNGVTESAAGGSVAAASSFPSSSSGKILNAQRSSNTRLHGMLMVLEGIGLAIIATATVWDGVELWKEIFNGYYLMQLFMVALWVIGRALQVAGLIVLIGHAASFQRFPSIEIWGLALLTIGPLLNMCSCAGFRISNDPSHLFNRQWMSNEALEFIGMLLIDIATQPFDARAVLFTAWAGYMTLTCSAVLRFVYVADSLLPFIGLRLDAIHASEGLGLFLLMVVAYGLYHLKMSKQPQYSLVTSDIVAQQV